MRSAALIVVVLAASAAVGHADGQVEPTPSALRPKTEVRLALTSSTVVTGRLVAWEHRQVILDEVVWLSASRSRLDRRSVATDSISAAWVRSGTRWKLGAAVGAAIGTVGMLVAGAFVLESQDGSSCNAACWMAAGAGGALIGGLAGALVGHQFVVWRPLRF